jgi:hypothetical protein
MCHPDGANTHPETIRSTRPSFSGWRCCAT